MAAEQSFWTLISEAVSAASWLEQAVLGFLALASVLSWAVVIMKWSALRKARRNDERFAAAFAGAHHTGQVLEQGAPADGPAPQHAIFAAAMAARAEALREAESPVAVSGEHIALRSAHQLEERVRLAMQHTLKREFARLQRHLTVLATAGSASPFIGLFGTVWGILATFQKLGQAKSASLQVLGPPIAGALIATAAGLAVAIPAVMFYNFFTARIDEEQEKADSLAEHLLRVLRATGATADPDAAPADAAPAARPA